MHSLDISFFWWALMGFALSSMLHILQFVIEKKIIRITAFITMAASFFLLTLAMVIRAVKIGHLPMTNMFEYLTLFAWSAAFFYFIFVFILRQQSVGVFIAPVIFILIVSASLLPKQPNEQLVPALQSIWLQIHVTLAALGEAAFAVAFTANSMFFLKKLFPIGMLGTRLPSFERLDLVSHKAIIIGYPLFTIGALFAGAIWAEQAWGTFWSWDPKEVCSLIVWCIYTIYFHCRFLHGWRGGKTALISMLGFCAALLTFYSNMFLSGLHSYK